MSGNIEEQLISKIIHTGDLVVATDQQISMKYFSGRNKKAYKYILEHSMKYGSVPTLNVFSQKMTSFNVLAKDEIQESLTFYCDEIRKKHKHNTIVDVMEEVSDSIEELETDEAYEMIKQLVMRVENEIILSDRVEVSKNTEARKKDYKERAKAGGMTGIPSGVDRYDYITKGYNNGELTTVLGYTGTGKTWWLLIKAVFMAKQGYKVLIFTTEMSVKMMIRRIDALWCKLSYTRFRDGKLTRDEEKRYFEYLDTIEGDTDVNLIVEQATGGVANISAKIDQHKPEMVFIDGGYLLADDMSDEDDWRALVRIWRGLHRLCLTKNVPIEVSTQSKERQVSLGTISFAKAIAADCDVITALEQDDEMKEDKEMKIKFLKMREGSIPGNIILNWDFDKMNYSTIYLEGNSGERLQDDIPDNTSEEEKNAKPKGVKILKKK